MALSVKQSADGTWTVQRDGEIIAAGLTNAAAWREADRIDEVAVHMEETRRRISIAVGQW
jgi:hypothetical protein